ncbi:HEPN domain-containing protein [Candidatus Bipolaricaulota bacterium]|nr:HEPN domain-containing protein [Candidatus Bipolaricaulota bacterium]
MVEDYATKALESLKAARILLEAGCYDSCISRCYYAMFQMAVAALEKLGIRPLKEGEYGHAWVQAAVAQELIRRRGLLPRKMASFLPDVLKIREEADYEPIKVGKKRARRTFRRTTEFIEQLQEVL